MNIHRMLPRLQTNGMLGFICLAVAHLTLALLLLPVQADSWLISPSDPVLIVHRERLEKILRALDYQENIELLLGQGSPQGDGSALYLLMSSTEEDCLTGCVRKIRIFYDDKKRARKFEFEGGVGAPKQGYKQPNVLRNEMLDQHVPPPPPSSAAKETSPMNQDSPVDNDEGPKEEKSAEKMNPHAK